MNPPIPSSRTLPRANNAEEEMLRKLEAQDRYLARRRLK
jgi:hypothetical protein